MKYKITTISLLLVLAMGSGVVHAEQAALQWLIKMGKAAQDLNYRGIFVYQHDLQLESMQIIHRVKRGITKERLLSLNNAPREIIRDNNIIRCYLPDEDSIVVEHRKANEKNFPRIIPKNLARLKDSYSFLMGPKERVTDRMAQHVIVKPKDKYRYGYHLWADLKSGLLLKSDLIDPEGKVLEQFMFTSLDIGVEIKDKDLEPRSSSLNLKKLLKSENKTPLEKTQWRVTSLPAGFVTTVHIKRTVPMHDEPVEHMVLTDGLAAVSVFIEKKRNLNQIVSGPNSMGAVNAYTRATSNHQITVIGEVPAITVIKIARAVELSK
ncbi:MAG: MucB/RseB C-terminal domain-containing protein [Acidiferrobacterales bacterium]